MGIENTQKWLRNHVKNPLKVCGNLTKYFGDVKEEELYEYLQHFGMYTSGAKAENDFNELVDDDVWTLVEKLFISYKEKWKGPDIPIFIIPHRKHGFFSTGHNKSGLAYSDKLLLFLTPKIDKKDIEALFIHEYHHVCRLNAQKKKSSEYTLTDSSILEGLAEQTVQKIMGAKYLAPWTKRYSKEFLDKFWQSHFEKNLQTTRKEKKHDQIMYGKGKYPFMIGYCVGFYLVEQYFQSNHFTIKSSFELPPKKIIDNYRNVKE